MSFYSIRPEVAGTQGDNTIYDEQAVPGMDPFLRLHYEFDGWLGDDFVCGPWASYLVTEPLAASIRRAGLTGASLMDAEVSTSEEFREVFPNLVLPPFVRLKVEGKPGEDDFGLAAKFNLIVSQTAFDVLQQFKIEYARVAEFRES